MSVATHSRSSSVDHDGDSILTDSDHQQQSAVASTSASASAVAAAPLSPSGPICAYGSRLAYTYFPSPAPRAEVLNQLQGEVHFFSVDDQLVYLSFFQDSGPLNAACLYRFCLHVHTLLEDASFKHKRVFLYSSDEPDKKANAALLMALYAMIVMRWSPADVLHPIACLELQPFRDAGYARADFHLSIQSCIYGIHRAIALHLLDLSTFDLVAYETYEKVENGDWNWLTPGFVAFASPVEPSYVASLSAGGASRRIEGGRPRLSKAFDNVLNEFETGGVKVVIRLNKKLYDAQHFKDRGMEHIEMYFDDGTNPPMEMTREFIDIADRTISAGGAVAVHCKAGLGRTGTLIGAYLIYKHGFSADEAIGFMRLMRPGSCVGPQQHYLYENQMTWVRWAAIDTLKAEQRLLAGAATSLSLSPERVGASTTPPRNKRPITPPNEEQLQRSRATTPSAGTAVPRTPGRPVAVPGQPRKTPGKSKHSVASPEVQHGTPLDEGEGGVPMVEGEGVTLREELMLVAEEDDGNDMLAAEAGEKEDGEHLPSNSSPRAPPPPQPRLAPPSAAATRSRTPTSTRPTRIARAATTTSTSTRARPLSAIADNRIVDRLGLNTGSGAAPSTSSSTRYTASSRAAPTRSKAVKDLGTLFEAAPALSAPDASASAGYNLRGGRTSPPTASSGLQPSLLPPASPSKLPQRVPAKRRGAAKEKDLPLPPTLPTAGRRERSVTSHAMRPLGGGGAAGPGGGGKRQELDEVEKTIASVGLSRSVRRRRSSLGSTDFVQ